MVDGSLKEAAHEPRWKEAALKEIRRCDVVVVLVGRYTYKAPRVLAEIAMARDEGKAIVQLIGCQGSEYTRVKGAGRVMSWTQSNLPNCSAAFSQHGLVSPLCLLLVSAPNMAEAGLVAERSNFQTGALGQNLTLAGDRYGAP